MTTAHAVIGPKIEIGKDFIRVIDLIVQNQVLSQILSEKPIEEQLMTLETILKLGAETYRLFGTTATNESIEKVGEKIATEISGKGEALIKDVKNIAAQMVANSGELSVRATLDIWRAEFSKMLELKFDPENKASILSQFDDLIQKKSQDQNAEIMNRLDFNVPTSAINMLQKNLNEHVTSQFGELGLKVDEITKSLAKAEQAKIDKKVQASRGMDFEAALFQIVASFAHIKSDVADNPGAQKISGLSGNDEGDITVEVSPKETHGENVAFVWEGKLRKDTISIKQCMEELQKGMTNRGCKVGIIAVEKVSGLSAQTGDVFKEINDTMAVLVLDPNDIDENAVHLAYLWARWKCLMDLGAALDTALVMTGINSIKQAMKSISTMRTNNTAVLRAIDSNSALFTALENNVAAELEKLSKAIEEVNAEKSEPLDQ